MLEGESLLNDASALVLLRTAVAAAAASFSFVATVGSFVWAVFSAVVIGGAVGAGALWLRARISSPTANTAIGLTVPYLASIPAEAVGGSGLVAAVAAGVLCGQGAIRMLTPEQRISDKATWGTIEFVLEGGLFLVMGLQLWGLVQADFAADDHIADPLLIAGAALLALILVRAAYVFTGLRFESARARRRSQRDPRGRSRRRTKQSRPEHDEAAQSGTERRVARSRRRQADRAYFDGAPLTWKHSTVVVWAGMRGAVTLAAAQTLPAQTPHRKLLLLVAFLVAAGSLLLQGLTLPGLVRVLGLKRAGAAGRPYEEIRRIDADLRRTAKRAVEQGATGIVEVPVGGPAASVPQLVGGDRSTSQAPDRLESDLALVRIMRRRLHELGRSGAYSTAALRYVMDELDASEISIKLHLESER